MKRLIPVFLAVLITAAGVFALVSSRKDSAAAKALAEQRAAWEAERAQLAKELEAAKKRPVMVQRSAAAAIESPAESVNDPEEILAKLKVLRASSRDPKSIRRVIFHLEQLHEIGPAAVPTIRAFLNRFEDMDYYSVREVDETVTLGGAEFRPAGNAEPDRGERGDREGRGGDRPRFNPGDFRADRRPDVRLTFVTPPSLRIGLVDVLQSIGGAEAEEALAEMLGSTGRAVEVAYVAKTLQEMAPNQHGVAAVTSAKDLLLNPAQGAAGDRLDENSKDYLYYVLTMFNDTSFAASAQAMLVTSEGRIDRHALNYLNSTLKAGAMPAIHQAYLDQRLTNQMERASLMNLALNYAGPNAQANEMLNSVISNDAIPSQMRAMALLGLVRGEPDAATIQARLPLVEALKGSTDDERVLRSLDFTSRNLQNMLEGKPVEDPWRAMRRGGDDRGRQDRQVGFDYVQPQSPEISRRYGLPPQ